MGHRNAEAASYLLICLKRQSRGPMGHPPVGKTEALGQAVMPKIP